MYLLLISIINLISAFEYLINNVNNVSDGAIKSFVIYLYSFRLSSISYSTTANECNIIMNGQ